MVPYITVTHDGGGRSPWGRDRIRGRNGDGSMQRRVGRGFSLLMCLVLVAALAGASHMLLSRESHAGSRERSVTAIDGDTIQLDGQVIQLYGIDAPEIGQHCLDGGVWHACGLAAAHELNKQLRLSRRQVSCQPVQAPDTGEYVCFAGDVDVAEALLMAGYVTARADANPDYRELEVKAKEARLGLWHSDFVPPADWRRGERLADEPNGGAEGCPIKAVAASGAPGRYYVPTDEGYESVTLDPAQGDRRYCSDETARQDGWRRAGETQTP